MLYLQKAINESEGEWSDNRKLLELNASNGDIRRALPKGFAYFAIDFGLQPGYAHIIEDEQRFPRNFAHVSFLLFSDLIFQKAHFIIFSSNMPLYVTIFIANCKIVIKCLL